MLWPVCETFAIIESHFPRPLISARAFSYIKRLTHRLPNATSSYYLECRLAAYDSKVDLLACVKATNRGQEILQRWDTCELCPESSSWSHVRDFCSTWSEPTSPLYKQVSHIWLEFDYCTRYPKCMLPPNLLFCLDPKYFERQGELQGNYITRQKYRQVLATTLGILLEQPVSSLTQQQLFSCFDKLPRSGRLIHISVMQTRTPITLKLNLVVPKDQFLDYLRQIGWTGSFVRVEAILGRYGSLVNHIKFQLTIENSILPKVDFEFHFDNESVNSPRPYDLLDQMVATNLCTAKQYKALLSWPGSFRHIFSHHSWPTRFYKWLDVKLVYHSHRPLLAKAYLGFMPSASIF